jgi:hypothetical protein
LLNVKRIATHHQELFHLQTHVIAKLNPLQNVEMDQPLNLPNVETTQLLNVKETVLLIHLPHNVIVKLKL